MSKLDIFEGSMLDTPIDYIESRNYYEKTLQYKINDTFEFASTNYEIEQEDLPGTLIFSKIVCRVNHIIKTGIGTNLGDDFREFIFKDMYSPKKMGQRFRFDKSDWITINTDNYKTVTKSAIVRRCNNALRHMDDNGIIKAEPCIMDYNMKYVNVYFNDTVDIPQGTVIVRLQNNSWTKTIKINDRFIIDGQVYKVKSVKNFLGDFTYQKDSAPIITLEVYLDDSSPNDNFELGIANMDRYENIYPPEPAIKDGIYITPDEDFIYQYESQTFECSEYLNGKKMNSIFTFTFSGVPKTNYSVDSVTENSFSITNKKVYLNLPLLVTVVSDNLQTTKEIYLKGLF